MTCFGARRHDRSRLRPDYQPVLYRDFDWSLALEHLAKVHFREAYSTGFIRSLARDAAYASADVLTRSGHRLLVLTVTNMGPGVVVLSACIGKPKAHWWTRGKLLSTINPIHNDPADPDPVGIGPLSAGLPTKIDTGDVKSFYFPYAKDCFLSEGLARVGINDTYQRNTWCRGRDMHKANRAYRRDFG
jgi:hypothetical protein